ncbi:fungal-specific transcription factor domain-containing protein [Trichoderma chlorosporum]
MTRMEARRRVALACDSCRERKVRCDGAKPVCGPCQARNRPLLCAYHVLSDSEKARCERAYVQSLRTQINRLEQQVEQRGDGNDTASPNATPSTTTAIREVPSPVSLSSSISRTWPRRRGTFNATTQTMPPHGTSLVTAMGAAVPARMAGDSLGADKQYYGQSSLVSLLRQACSDRNGTENGPHAEKQQVREPRRIPPAPPPALHLHDQYCLPPRQVTDALLDIYRKDVHIFHPWIHLDSFMALYRSIWSENEVEEGTDLPDIGIGGSDCTETVFYCALNAMLAEACQFSNMPPQDKRSCSAMFYERARKFLQVDLLDCGSLSHIQSMLLVAQYLQCTELATQCWNLVGMAYRMSVAIGLHHDEMSASLSSLEREMRRRTWHACLQMELVESMTLGRPAQSGIKHNVPLPLAIDDEYLSSTRCECRQPDGIVSRNQYLVESLKLVQILGQVLSTMYDVVRDGQQEAPGAATTGMMKASFLDMLHIEASLDNFELFLHPSLKWDVDCPNVAANTIFTRQSNVLHARLLHLKLLLHRPALSLYCSSKESNDSSSTKLSGLNRFSSPYLTSSAVICVEAACGLIDVVDRAVASSSAGAWWYCVFYLISASLVLTLAEPREDLVARLKANAIVSAWSKCDRALLQIAETVDEPGQDYATALRKLRRLSTGQGGQQFELSQRENRHAPINQLDLDAEAALFYETLYSQLGRQSVSLPEHMAQDYLDPALQDYYATLGDIRLPAHLALEGENHYTMPGLF